MNQDPHYTVFVRLPFPRESFEDPAQVQWDASKDKQLWKAISSASNSRDLDWDALSRRFDAPLPFLLQQAAWLYERHFEGMKAQMKKLSVANASPAPGTPTLEAARQRTGSGGSTPRLPAAINTQRASSVTQIDGGSIPGTPRGGMPPISRTPSTNTVTQSRAFTGSRQSQRRPLSSRGNPGKAHGTSLDEGDSSSFRDDRSAELDSEDETDIARTNTFSTYRSAKASQTETLSADGDAEDDEDADSSGGFLPFASSSKALKSGTTATIRQSLRRQPGTSHKQMSTVPEDKSQPPSSSVSSVSSAQQPLSPDSQAEYANLRQGTLSPQQRAQLARLSPRYKKSGSEGSPSMGSSFSDLDDTSITQSAMGEALLSNMQHGSLGMGSRMSTLRDALGKR